MIVKIRDLRNSNAQAWINIGGIRSATVEIITPGNESVLYHVDKVCASDKVLNYDGYSEKIVSSDIVPNCHEVLLATIVFDNGDFYSVLANRGNIFIMNDEGKTIDKY